MSAVQGLVTAWADYVRKDGVEISVTIAGQTHKFEIQADESFEPPAAVSAVKYLLNVIDDERLHSSLIGIRIQNLIEDLLRLPALPPGDSR